MADVNPTISIMILNVNGLNNLTKSRDCQTGLKKNKNKTRSNYMVTIGDTLRFKYTEKLKSKRIEKAVS